MSQIDDGKANVPKRRMAIHEVTLLVRTTMENASEHPLETAIMLFAVQFDTQEASNSTHTSESLLCLQDRSLSSSRNAV